MDHPSYCAGKCTGTAMQAADGGWLCMDCGLSLEARKAKQRKVVMPLPTVRQRAAAMLRHPATQSKRLQPEPDVMPKREVVVPDDVERIEHTLPCTSCDRGVIGRLRWAEGHRQCTRCAPLEIAEVGINKAAPALMLLEQVSPEQVAGGRRRP